MKFQRKKRENVDITLISMIDVLFVLLLFFMVSTTFNQHTEIKINLPEAKSAESEQHPKMVTLTINADGIYYLNGDDGLPHELVSQTPESLKQELLKLKGLAGQIPFVINADDKTPYQFVITALSIAAEVGFHSSLSIQAPKEE